MSKARRCWAGKAGCNRLDNLLLLRQRLTTFSLPLLGLGACGGASVSLPCSGTARGRPRPTGPPACPGVVF